MKTKWVIMTSVLLFTGWTIMACAEDSPLDNDMKKEVDAVNGACSAGAGQKPDMATCQQALQHMRDFKTQHAGEIKAAETAKSRKTAKDYFDKHCATDASSAECQRAQAEMNMPQGAMPAPPVGR